MMDSKLNLERNENPWSIAFGKTILLGEHAVVYGVPAIAVGIPRGAMARVVPHEPGQPSSILRIEGIPVALRDDNDDRDLAQSFRALLEECHISGPVTVEARTDLPPGGGLGCSAALGVAIARALEPDASTELIAKCALAWERIHHGNPSGIDTSISASGGCILFERGRGFERVHAASLHICIGHTGAVSSTKSMVESVARLRERKPVLVEQSCEGIRSLVKMARIALEAGDRRTLGQLMDLNQTLLRGLSLSTPEIDRMCARAHDAGALGAKLTGAGGGGCVIALAENQESADGVLRVWKDDGFDGFLVTTPDHEPAVAPPSAEQIWGSAS